MIPLKAQTYAGIQQADLPDLLATAGRAPSLHNSQPWQFRLVHGALELRIRPERALPISDPRARELVISCGAALFNLRLALRCKAMVAHVDVAPASGDPLLLARISAEPGQAATPDEARLLAAVVHRHTHRHGFTSTRISERLAADFCFDVAAEGARLVWIDDPDQVRAVAELALAADALQVAEPAWQAEVSGWVGAGRRDGIPSTALPAGATGRADTDRLPSRTFLADRPSPPRAGQPGRIAVLVTPGDHRADWLAAGQGLQRMLLRGAKDWVFATYATAPLEIPHLRHAVRERLGLKELPQMLVELGYAGTAHATPRLPVDPRAGESR